MNKFIVAVVGVLMFTFNAYGADNKIGFVDFQKALNESRAGIEAKDRLEKEGAALADDLDEKQKVLKKLNDEIEKKKSVWDKKVLDKKVEDFKAKLETFQSEANEKREMLNSKRQTDERKIIEDLKELVSEVADKKGYSVILEKSAGGVIYFNAEDDITNIVIQSYDKAYRKSKKK